jgi:hypothetical protein
MIMGVDPVVVVAGQRDVLAGDGDVVTARLPEPAEAARLGLQAWAGVPVISVRRAGQPDEELYVAGQVRVLVQEPGPALG